MSKVCAIHQPNFAPWLGFFYKITHSDTFVLLDSAQYSKNNLINRNRIKTPQGELWLTVPVLSKGRFGQLISETEINMEIEWKKQHLSTLRMNYGRTPFFSEVFSLVEKVYGKNGILLSAFNAALLDAIFEYLDFAPRVMMASVLQDLPNDPTARLVQICKQVGADTYLCGQGGSAEYQETGLFDEARICLKVSEFRHPVYPQLWNKIGFVQNLSIFDALFNVGKGAIELFA